MLTSVGYFRNSSEDAQVRERALVTMVSIWVGPDIPSWRITLIWKANWGPASRKASRSFKSRKVASKSFLSFKRLWLSFPNSKAFFALFSKVSLFESKLLAKLVYSCWLSCILLSQFLSFFKNVKWTKGCRMGKWTQNEPLTLKCVHFTQKPSFSWKNNKHTSCKHSLINKYVLGYQMAVEQNVFRTSCFENL